MLGRDMETQFHGEDYVAVDREDIDLTDKERVVEYLFSTRPDMVINCSGYTNVDGAEEEEEKANEINGYAVGVLAKACREIDATLVHFSTDYVFDGKKKEGYNEDDSPAPLNAYGRSKLLGENLLIDEMESLTSEDATEGKYFLIRTSWLYGQHGPNFVDTLINSPKNVFKVVSDQFGKPTYTKDFCEQVKWLITSREYGSGIYHITNEDTTSWFDFAKEIFSVAGKQADVLACGSEEYPVKAKRPKCSVLINNKLPKLRSWKEALKDYIANKS